MRLNKQRAGLAASQHVRGVFRGGPPCNCLVPLSASVGFPAISFGRGCQAFLEATSFSKRDALHHGEAESPPEPVRSSHDSGGLARHSYWCAHPDEGRPSNCAHSPPHSDSPPDDRLQSGHAHSPHDGGSPPHPRSLRPPCASQRQLRDALQPSIPPDQSAVSTRGPEWQRLRKEVRHA